jgi:hypothetical protein
MMLTPQHRRSKRARVPPKRYNDASSHTKPTKTECYKSKNNNNNSKQKNKK